jgi:aspartate kinase
MKKPSSGTLITFEEDVKMEQAVVSGIAFNRDEAKITVMGVPDKPGIAYQILVPGGRGQHRCRRDHPERLARRPDRLLVHRAPQRLPAHDGPAEDEGAAGHGAAQVLGDPKICKVSIVGIGMRSHVGVASKMFRALSEEGINIQMITTSEIKTSVVIDEKYMELAVRALHRAFDLDQPATAEA